jgi:hypothetical protein
LYQLIDIQALPVDSHEPRHRRGDIAIDAAEFGNTLGAAIEVDDVDVQGCLLPARRWVYSDGLLQWAQESRAG